MPQFIEILIFACILLPLSLAGNHFYQTNKQTFYQFIIYIGCSFAAYFFTSYLIPFIKELTLKADLFGKDINKKGTPEGEVKVPESLGIVPATIFLIFNVFGLAFTKQYSDQIIFQHTAGLLSICFMIFLGFSDDVLDLRWRYKLVLPTIATLPILIAYSGSTMILLPIQLRFLLGQTFNLGILYYIYMAMLSVFCTNSINIYAGINGLEVGQSLIIGCSVLLHNIIEIIRNESAIIVEQHQLSLIIILPYIFASLGLFKHNKFDYFFLMNFYRYPSKVFVGDTFCYWSGMTFAVVGICGHFSKTLLLFFIPQIINFLYSLPQLINPLGRIINCFFSKYYTVEKCPRHRLPKYNTQTGKLEAVKSHMNLLNLFLWIKGPTTEKNTCTYLIIFQILCCGFGFFIRYIISHSFF